MTGLPGEDWGPHAAEGFCDMCQDNATRWNHCSYCGKTFTSRRNLARHGAKYCDDAMMLAITRHRPWLLGYFEKMPAHTDAPAEVLPGNMGKFKWPSPN